MIDLVPSKAKEKSKPNPRYMATRIIDTLTEAREMVACVLALAFLYPILVAVSLAYWVYCKITGDQWQN